MNICSKFLSKKVLTFVAGTAAGLILPPIIKSNTARKAAVTVTAKGMQLKDDARCAFDTIKEEAEDVYAEAKEKNSSEAE